MTLAPLALVAAYPWQRVVFTTYALSLSFVEAVILDALVRGGSSQALILADVQGVRASLGELGAQRVGKDYDVEPVVVNDGVFHPKISVFCSADECHVLVGSGNLTFGGWGGNCEILEHLHPSFAADAILEAARFFELMATSGRVQHNAQTHCRAIAEALDRATRGRPRNGDIRLLHSLETSISEQLVAIAEDLGGASRIVAAAPYWDDGAAIDQLCASLGLDRVFLHSHEHGCVQGKGAANWPRRSRINVQAVRLSILDAPETRKLHAKAFEILCRRGRIVVSGSANGSRAALDRDRNVEICVARIQRERTVGWTFSSAPAPDPQPLVESVDDDDGSSLGVLRAVLEADELAGMILIPKMIGSVAVYHLAAIGPELLGRATVNTDGVFRIRAAHLEERVWRGGRLVVRVEDQRGRRAEGFVSVASFADITRRAGFIGRRLFALLAGTETPADVAAIMSWFHEDPQRLSIAAPHTIDRGSDSTQHDDSDELVAVATLGTADATMATALDHRGAAAEHRWSRFVEQILSAFLDSRGPLARAAAGRPTDDEDDDSGEIGSTPAPAGDDPAIARSLEVFDRLFATLTRDGGPARNALVAFDLTQYLCDRLRPEPAQARKWLERLINVLLEVGVPAERRSAVAASVLALVGNAPAQNAYRWARGCLLRLDVDFGGDPPSPEGARGSLEVLPQQLSFAQLWSQLIVTRSYPEQVRSYLKALDDGAPSYGYPDLQSAAPEEWPRLEAAIATPAARREVLLTRSGSDVCPRCNMTLPRSEIVKLHAVGIATAKNCCRNVLIVAEG